jgi:PAS domain S-box-containing protein
MDLLRAIFFPGPKPTEPEAWRQQAETLRRILDTLPVGVWIADTDSKLIFSNPAGRSLWGGPGWVSLNQSSQLIARWTKTGERIKPHERSLTRALLRGEIVLNEEVEIEGFDGSRRTILNSAIPLRDPEDKIIGALVVDQDITDRKLIEAALRDSEIKARAILENAADGLIIADDRGVIQSTNRAADRIFGYDAGELEGLTLKHLVPRPYPAEDKTYRSPSQKPSVFPVVNSTREVMGQRKHGEIFPLDLAASQIFFDDRRLYIAIVRDNTERKRAQQELSHSHEQLRALAAHLQSIREEERFRIAREIHDELGQSLTGLKLDLAWIMSRLPADGPPLRQRAKTMSALIDNTIQTVRRIATDLRPGILDNLGLVAALEWQAAEFQNRTGIQCRCLSRLDDTGLDAERRTALFRIFQETLTNVARHSQATIVEVRLQETAGQLVLEVSDNGQGFSEKQITDPRSVGLLGMRERAHILGGELQITSAPDQGTTVTARIPMPETSPANAAP